MKKRYDTFIIGHVSLDEIVYNGETERMPGGAVLYSSYAAVASGYKTGLLTKTAPADAHLMGAFNVEKGDAFNVVSKKTTSIRSEYLSADRERRNSTALSIADTYTAADIPDVDSKIFHIAGLIAGDYDNDLLPALSKRGQVAVDVQGFLRHAIDGTMLYRDWAEKGQYLPYVDFLKTDAAEAEVMTGLEDRYKAAEVLHGWGAKEIMITHNSEVIIYDGKKFYSAPLKPRNLSGRTGRGDTCFSGYIVERTVKGPEESVRYAAALVSLKMETPGPFKGTRKDVEDYINRFYK